MNLLGLHHVTAITAHARENLHFYTHTLGLRLVKKTVNQDDVRAYHLFYADAHGTPGTDLTFFDWDAPPERRGTHAITRTALRVHGERALQWWADHLHAHGINANPITTRDHRAVLDFEDPEGQRLTLIDDGGHGDAHPWTHSPVPAEHQIRGLGPVTISVPTLRATNTVLTRGLFMNPARTYPHPDHPNHTVHVYTMGEGGAHAELHVAVQPDLPVAHQGAGAVHHVAFRVPDEDALHAWAEHLHSLGLRTSGEVERYYFRSLYFRDPSGVLFELATDTPGFTADEPIDTLGTRLALPPFLEPRRADIEAHLKPLD
ncbi:ring-cleaving dioxygenase [Deinococcus maricopensis]|uniref:Glyoxalase/bleomycin resistance protein/dioxygenase n=1 Tax=Deinococcus maricopensis (strain DSM 21211 / LMG 22137 / NRRL B-23946 / LB-34) TaxID=709986 RepID=E8U8K2_DEIML|nr:ring-cleaving dioxygenase [Deinococcus maricopensis]ADV67391.1 Glyoxalase/bleomycin resistance protein/dioxygenase [Deinococcus maricopensis DSM 21211]